MGRPLVIFSLSVLAVGLATLSYGQPSGTEVEAASSESGWTAISAANRFYERLVRQWFCSSGSRTTTSPTTTSPSTSSTTSTSTSSTSTTNTAAPSFCGTFQLRVYAGTVIPRGYFPWLVYITGRNMKCAGTLIHDQWVLSSASRLYPDIAYGVNVTVGIVYYTKNGTTSAGSVLVHEMFNNSLGYQPNILLPHDIALVHLTANLSGVTPICLPINEANLTLISECVFIVGWARNFAFDTFAKAARMVVSEDNNTKCPTILASSICLSSFDNRGPCTGDGGGFVSWTVPVIGRMKLVGIIADNTNTCSGTIWEVRVTKVSTYLSWIQTRTGLQFCAP